MVKWTNGKSNNIDMQSKQQTALWIAGSKTEFWQMSYEVAPDCYDALADVYNGIDFDDTEGQDADGEPVNLGDYPTRKIPPIKHGFQ